MRGASASRCIGGICALVAMAVLASPAAVRQSIVLFGQGEAGGPSQLGQGAQVIGDTLDLAGAALNQ